MIIMTMYKHVNKGNGTITIADKDGKFYTIFPGGTVSMNRIHERKGIVCINKDEKEETEQVIIEEPDYMSEDEKKPRRLKKKKLEDE